MALFLKTIFLLIILFLTISVLLKSRPNLCTNVQHQEDTKNSAEILTTEEFPNFLKYYWSPRKIHKFTDFSKTFRKSGRPLWKSIIPSFNCPTNLLSRVGGAEDGGKWTCGLNNLGKLGMTSLETEKAPCVVYSFGVANDSFFEAEVLATTHCEVYAYDPTVSTIAKPLSPSNPRVHFTPLGIGNADFGKLRTLKTFMEQNEGHKWIDILKMDVEYAEYPSLERILKDFPSEDNGVGGLPFGQLLVEMHVKKALNKTEASDVVYLFKRLEARGLRIFYEEINPDMRGHRFSEFSFINTNEYALKRFTGDMG